MTDEVRALIQAGTLLLATIALVQFAVVVRCGIFPWRYVIMPAVVAAEIVAFYGVLVIVGPLLDFSIGRYANFISAVIRFQSAAVLTSFLSYRIYKRIRERRV